MVRKGKGGGYKIAFKSELGLKKFKFDSFFNKKITDRVIELVSLNGNICNIFISNNEVVTWCDNDDQYFMNHPFEEIYITVNPHPHAYLMLEYANDAFLTDEPWTLWEENPVSCGVWHKLREAPKWHKKSEYRKIEKHTSLIGDIEINAPVKDKPENHTWVYTPDMLAESKFYTMEWIGTREQNRMLDLGLIHLVKQSAIEHCEALLKLNKGDD